MPLKQRAKHAAKIHVWAGISWKGATRIVIFGGILNADRLGVILENALVPFIILLDTGSSRIMIQSTGVAT